MLQWIEESIAGSEVAKAAREIEEQEFKDEANNPTDEVEDPVDPQEEFEDIEAYIYIIMEICKECMNREVFIEWM